MCIRLIFIVVSLIPGDSSKPQPYQSDLEYLEDNFQLIETKVKAMKMEQSDDSFLLRADQRKPEAVIREMKAKARSLRAKINQRMLATHKVGGKVIDMMIIWLTGVRSCTGMCRMAS
jgi:hypothetical protein